LETEAIVYIIHAILQAAAEVKQRKSRFVSNGYPDTCDNLGNDAAYRLVKDVVSLGKTHPLRPVLTRKRALIRDTVHAR
jgi:hypothetical protein